MRSHSPTNVNMATRPPGPRGYPFVGVLPGLLRDPLWLFSEAVSRYGDAVVLPVGGQHFYLFNHPDYFKYVLQENHHNYQKGTSYKKIKFLLGEGLATSEGELWLRQRRLTQPAFHHQRLVAISMVMSNAAETLIAGWRASAASRRRIDIMLEMMQLTQQIILTTMFSSSIGDDAERVCRAFDTALKHLSSSLWLSALPDRLTPGHRQFNQALQTIDTVVYRIIEERRRAETDPGDLLSMLLHARDEESGEGMNDRQLRDEVLTIFIAGHETTATTLAWAWHMLAQHPEVERRLHEELSAVLGGRTPTFQDLPRLNYTRMVIEEVLRLFPPGWSLFRTALADDVIGGYHVPAGSVVVLCPYVLHRTAGYWEQPERFLPERFSPEQASGRPAFTYMPFGGGPRLCIGKSFAMMEAQLILAAVAQHYQLRAISGRPVKPSVEVVLRPRSGTPMTLHSRSNPT